MAFPPLAINEAVPGDSDIVSQFPALERTFRNDIEDWSQVEHNTYGIHKMPSLTTAERDAETNWSVGGLIYNETLKQLQFTLSVDPDVWYSEGVPTATRCVFQQTSAPTGYTKESNASYNDATVISTTGAVGTAGTVAASTFYARTGTDAVTLVAGNIPTLTGGNFGMSLSGTLPNHTHSVSIGFTTSTDGSHSHTYGNAGGTVSRGSDGPDTNVSDTSSGTTSTDGSHNHSGTVSGNTGNPNSLPSISVTGSISYTNGSQTTFTPAIDCRLKRFSVIVATKD